MFRDWHGVAIESNDVLSFDKMAREEAASCMEHLHVYECEVKSLKTLTQRVVLTHEEMVFTNYGLH